MKRVLVDWTLAGSSPLTRGKLDLGIAGTPRHRLIPAHAGKTEYVEAYIVTGGAHPRSRGENIRARVRVGAHHGSSPLTRGKHVRRSDRRDRRRLIPAHAGKT